MALYDLTVQGVSDFLMRRPGMSRFMRRQPLAGLVDGSTLIYLLPMYPCLQTINVYLGASLVSPASYSFYAETGTVQFASAPTVQPTADYTAIQLSNQQIVYYLWAGFQMMESLWSRKYGLSSSSTAYSMADPTSANIYLCQGPLATGAVPTDPVCGQLTFSTSQLQRAWLARCSEFAYLDSMTIEAALSDINVHERVGGVAITTDHRSKNILQAKQSLWDEIVAAMYAALDEYDPTYAHYGGVATPQHTEYYTSNWNWQNNSGILIPAGIGAQWW